jgi:hypothetical protein
MRTKTLLLTAALCAAGIATSSAQSPVYSVNAVGYVNTPLVKGYNLISNPLDNKATDGNKIKNLFATLPPGSQIFKFDAATAKYVLANVDDFTGEVVGPASDLTLKPGEGVFVQSPAAAQITFVGEVPTGTLSTPLAKGYSIVSSQVPQAGLVSALGFAPEEGDQIFQWDEATQKYVTHGFEFGEWSGGEPNLDVGEAVFLNNNVATTRSWNRTFSISQ